MTRLNHLFSASSSSRGRHIKPVHLVIIALLGLMTACAPQASLPTQAALPTQSVPQSTAVSTAVPSDTPFEANQSIGTTELNRPQDTPVPAASPTAIATTSSGVSQPAPVSTSEPTIRVIGVPHISVAEPAVPNVIVIQTSASDMAALERQVKLLGGTLTRDPALGILGAAIITLPDNANPSEVAKLAEVGRTEPDYYAVALAEDPLVSQQWGRSLLRLDSVKLPTNAPLVKVAVIDSGACFDHPDLAGQYLPGWDYVENDADPRDTFGHGCEVSGIIAAVQNNSIGIAGISAQIRILPYRVLDERGVGRYSNVSAAIVRAVQDGAQVINLSLGGPSNSELLTQAVNYARQAGVMVVAAAGNSGQAQVFYPAALDGVISVGSIGETHLRSPFSNYGKIDVWAAGENVLTTMMDGTYSRVNGTSFAAPHVAGLAALEIATGQQLVADGRIAVYGGSGAELAIAPTPLPTQNTVVTYAKPAMKNPAALVCTNLGYDYVITTDGSGSEDGKCLMPDSTTQCEQWDFYAGTCGQAFNYCAQQGYETLSLSDGKDPYAQTYAACADANGQEIGSVADLSALQAQASGCDDGSCNSSQPAPTFSEAGRVDPADDPVNALAVPTSWDWRNYNGADWLTPIKNQGGCGSCGVFSAMGIIEAALAIGAGNPGYKPDLSEQYMISTCYMNPNSICSYGSHSHWTLEVAKASGMCDEGCMPYQAVSTDCGTKCGDYANRLTKIADYGYTFTGITQAYIKQLIVNRGPVAVYIRISNGSYSNGYLTCSVDSPIDHAVDLVGYNDAGGYWIMRNSWGVNWGESGYTKVRYGDCGIDSNYVAYASALPAVPANTALISNGGFDQNTTGWSTFGEVDWVLNGGGLAFKRRTPSPTGFSIYQDIKYRFPRSTPVEVLVDLGNTSNVQKTIEISLHNRNNPLIDDTQKCTVTLPPQAPMRTYAMELLTGEWPNGRFEIGLLQADGLPDVTMDNVRVTSKTGITAFKCRYPQALADTELLYNNNFALGAQGWNAPSDLVWSVAPGDATFVSKSATPAAVYQNTARRLAANSPIELNFNVKNPNPTLRTIKVTLIDNSNLNWSAPNLITCTFDLPPNQTGFGMYTIKGKLPTDTANLRLNIEVPTSDTALNIVFSSFVLSYKPTLVITTSPECILPTNNPPTAAPLVTLPASPTTDNTPTIVVGTVPQGESYELEIATAITFDIPVMYSASLMPATLVHTTSALADGTYYIHARAVKNSPLGGVLYGPWSAPKSLVIDNTPPDVPTPLLPAASPPLRILTPTLTWQAVTGAASYDIDLGLSDPPNQTPVRVTAPSWVVNRPLAVGVYSWRVRSRDVLGNVSAWSASASFTMESAVGSAPRPNPMTSTPTLTWMPLKAAVGYQVQIASDKLFTKIVYDNALVAGVDSSVTITPPLGAGAYYYRVRAKIGLVWGAWSVLTPLVVNQ